MTTMARSALAMGAVARSAWGQCPIVVAGVRSSVDGHEREWYDALNRR